MASKPNSITLRWEAITGGGFKTEGKGVFENEDALRAILIDQGYRVTSITQEYNGKQSLQRKN